MMTPKQRLPLLTTLPFVFALTLAACGSVNLSETSAASAPVTTAAVPAPADAASAPAADGLRSAGGGRRERRRQRAGRRPPRRRRP